ncbi:uncharacterized protein PG986_013317 [Apiospora aurea]|uniref:Uncharacterized protein n=1 Tax=Apiospora aurea TaxID=335848 RepID=A0ABR1PV96_9PEZI
MAAKSLLSSPPRPLLARNATRCGLLCAVCAVTLILIPALTLYGSAYYSTIAAAATRPASSAAKIIPDHRLHHYAVKSRQEYEEKILRSNAMSAPKGEGFWNRTSLLMSSMIYLT